MNFIVCFKISEVNRGYFCYLRKGTELQDAQAANLNCFQLVLKFCLILDASKVTTDSEKSGWFQVVKVALAGGCLKSIGGSNISVDQFIYS